MYIQDFEHLPSRNDELACFLTDPQVKALEWPDEVVEQWLYDHAPHGPFQRDYGHINLNNIVWSKELVPTREFLTIPTGPSEEEAIESWATIHEHAVMAREDNARHNENSPHAGIREKWELEGTWLRPPVVLEGQMVNASYSGLILVEGRTRVGVLRGRHRDCLKVADEHWTWVGRPRS